MIVKDNTRIGRRRNRDTPLVGGRDVDLHALPFDIGAPLCSEPDSGLCAAESKCDDDIEVLALPLQKWKDPATSGNVDERLARLKRTPRCLTLGTDAAAFEGALPKRLPSSRRLAEDLTRTPMAMPTENGSSHLWEETCLSGQATCRQDAPCDPEMAHPRSCLTAHIPAWVATTARVQCCMRCCLTHWLNRLGLADNARHWQRMNKRFDVSSGTGGPEAEATEAATLRQAAAARQAAADDAEALMESVLFFRFSMARFAHVQAISLADWSALIADDADIRNPRFSTPSAAHATEALVCLNGFGRIMGTR